MNLKYVPVLIGLFVLSQTLTGQETSVSPYSAFGVGNLLNTNDVEQAGMGGFSMTPLNPYYATGNFSNPAANRDLKATSFKAALNSHTGRFNDGVNKSTQNSTYISEISLAFPVGNRARAGFGFRPYSTVGYDLATTTNSDEVNYTDRFKGEGGLNKFNAMGSYNITNEFSVGLSVNYLFGDISKIETVSTEELALQTDYSLKTKINGFQFGLGGMYTKILDDKRRIDVGVNYTLGSKLTSHIEDMTTTYSLVGLTPANIDTVLYSKINGKMKLPQSFSIGASFRKDLHWMAGLQVDYGTWKDFSIDTKAGQLPLNSQFRISAGGYWIPNFNSYKSYFDRVVYRAGLFYETMPVKIRDEGINKFGLTFGFGLPVGKDRDASMLNLGFELGSLGNTKSLPFSEKYFNAKVGFTINDVWFRKRVID